MGSSARSRFAVWDPTRGMTVSPEGKHLVEFDAEFPFALRFYLFSFHHRVTPTFHDYLEASYIYEGRGVFSVENKRYEVAAGDILVIGNSGFHRLEARPGERLKVLCVFFLPELVYRIGGGTLDFEYLGFFYHSSPEFVHAIPAGEFPHERVLKLIEGIDEELRQRSTFHQLAVKNQLLQILLLIARYYRVRSPNLHVYDKRRNDIRRLNDVFAYLDARYSGKISLAETAATAHLSSAHFCRLFKRVTGCTLTEYVFRLRIDKAKELLVKGEQSITEIALETGFESHSYFDRIFHRFTGVSPLEYRKNAPTLS